MSETLSYGCLNDVRDVGPGTPVTQTLACPKNSQGHYYGKRDICRQSVEPNVPVQYRNQLTYATQTVSAPQDSVDQGSYNWNFAWNKTNCAAQYTTASFVAPSGLTARYDDFDAPGSTASAASITYSDVTSLNGADPNGPAGAPYACAEFPKKCELYDVNPSGGASADCPMVAPAPAGLPSSVFNGLQNRYNYSADALRAALRSAAQGLGMASHMYLEPVATDVVTSNDDSLYGAACPGSDIVCATKAFTTGAQLMASCVPGGTTPAACVNASCYTRTTSACGVGAGTGSGVTTAFSTATSLAQQEFMAAFSRARFDCQPNSTAPDCAWVSAAQIGDEVEVTTKLNVPFYFLGANTRQMSHTQRRKLERTYVR
jgi:hypothetical protein